MSAARAAAHSAPRHEDEQAMLAIATHEVDEGSLVFWRRERVNFA